SELVSKNRASFLVMGPLLARFGQASSCPPGGDVLGQRPIDVHLAGFIALGAEVSRQDDKYLARAASLNGTTIFMDYPSHIGTENLLMAATMAKGKTVIKNASSEPEVASLAQVLNQMGARISGAGTSTIEIEGVPSLGAFHHRLIPDRLEAGTFAIAAALAGGRVTLTSVCCGHLDSLLWKLKEAGAQVAAEGDCLTIASSPLRATNIQALPYPGFATDLQPTMGVLLTQAQGVSVIQERVYENRFLYVGELRKMGAEVMVAGQLALVSGPTPLIGTPVKALDIRSGAALVLAGLVARGTTEISDVYHLDRGYERLEEKLQGLGAHIRREGSGQS
ncbi:MAG TPA: UDP-N-acetylglucosamine 1-carboxyvinyltransferase, partial [Dehalococcoidia bacterium]|nr:UDP-N-acetylglucosamine 1-carboxyvinyltransferase [Dehalococcoidia bacterium]